MFSGNRSIFDTGITCARISGEHKRLGGESEAKIHHGITCARISVSCGSTASGEKAAFQLANYLRLSHYEIK